MSISHFPKVISNELKTFVNFNHQKQLFSKKLFNTLYLYSNNINIRDNIKDENIQTILEIMKKNYLLKTELIFYRDFNEDSYINDAFNKKRETNIDSISWLYRNMFDFPLKYKNTKETIVSILIKENNYYKYLKSFDEFNKNLYFMNNNLYCYDTYQIPHVKLDLNDNIKNNIYYKNLLNKNIDLSYLNINRDKEKPNFDFIIDDLSNYLIRNNKYHNNIELDIDYNKDFYKIIFYSTSKTDFTIFLDLKKSYQ
jgi:hypothetical protein